MEQNKIFWALNTLLFLLVWQPNIYGSGSEDYSIDFETITAGSDDSQSEDYLLQSGFISIGSQESSSDYFTETINLIPHCGNGIKENEERCDSEDFGGITCKNSGYVSGELQCENNCQKINYERCVVGGGSQNYGGGYINNNPASWGLEDEKQEETDESIEEEEEDGTKEESSEQEDEETTSEENIEETEDDPPSETDDATAESNEESGENPTLPNNRVIPGENNTEETPNITLVNTKQNTPTKESNTIDLQIPIEGFEDTQKDKKNNQKKKYEQSEPSGNICTENTDESAATEKEIRLFEEKKGMIFRTETDVHLQKEKDLVPRGSTVYHFPLIKNGDTIRTSDSTPLIIQKLKPNQEYNIHLTNNKNETIIDTLTISDKKGLLLFHIKNPLVDGEYRIQISEQKVFEKLQLKTFSIVVNAQEESIFFLEDSSGQYGFLRNTKDPYQIGKIDMATGIKILNGNFAPNKEIFVYLQKVDQDLRRIGMANISQTTTLQKNIFALKTKTDAGGRFSFNIPTSLDPGDYRLDIIPEGEEDSIQPNISLLFSIHHKTNIFFLTSAVVQIIVTILAMCFLLLIWKKRKKEKEKQYSKKRNRKK